MFNRLYIISVLVGARPRTPLGRIIFALYFGAGVLSLIGVIWLAVQGWLYGWQTSDWERLNYSFSLLLGPAMFIFYGLCYWLTHPARLWPRYRFLRDALMEQAVDLPEVIPSVEPLPPERLRNRPVRFGALRRFAGSPYMGYLLLFGLFFPAISVSNSLPRALGASSDVADHIESAGIPFALAFFALPYLFLLAWWIAHERWRLQVTADAEGLAWRWNLWGKTRQMAWSEVRAFYRVSRVADRLSRPVYILYFADGSVFSWVTTYVSSTREYRETARLARIIVSRTGQPLRDADVFFERAEQVRRHNGAATDITPALAGIIAVYRRVQRRMVLSLVVTFVVFFALMGSALVLPNWGLQRIEDAQVAYFTSLPAKLHNAPLLYANSMRANDGLWPVTATSGEQHLTFTNGAYQMSDPQNMPVIALIANRYTDAAIEVTVRQSVITAGSNAEAGIAFHAANSNEMLLFTINAKDGRLNLYLYRQTYPSTTLQDALFDLFPSYGGDFDMRGIQTPNYRGPGTANTLLVVMRGPLYLCYANGQYVGQFTDKYDIYKPPATGQVGLFVADGGDPATFTNFAVYGVKQPPLLDYL